jgi:hypothetical protein
MANKNRIHHEWFQRLSKTRCECGSKPCRTCGTPTTHSTRFCSETCFDKWQTTGPESNIPTRVEVFAWGEYVAARWRTILHFCQACFQERVIPHLINHANQCGCSFELKAKSGHSLPNWIKMPKNENQSCHANSS